LPAATRLVPEQVAAQAVLQQWLSAEQVVVEMHPPAIVVHVCPCLLLQDPVASQVPGQLSVSS
jgi:hypothetical protein